MELGYSKSIMIVNFGRNINEEELMLACKRMFTLCTITKQYMRFENVHSGLSINDYEIDTCHFTYADFVRIYKKVIKDHIYARTRKW